MTEKYRPPQIPSGRNGSAKLAVIDNHSQSTTVRRDQALFAQFEVILPSKFTGGRLEFRHDGYLKEIDVEKQSSFFTSIVAACTGVEQTMAAVTSGYRLTLVYDIAEPQTATPQLPAVLEAGHVRACTPQFTCVRRALISDDKALLLALRPVAEELRFSLYFAHVEVVVKTMYPVDESQTQGYGISFAQDGNSFYQEE
ncbi:hypothetical protein DFH07DRAFT_936331, partial [Mycena maculata]